MLSAAEVGSRGRCEVDGAKSGGTKKVYARKVLKFIGYAEINAFTLYQDNTSAIVLAKEDK